MRLPPGSRHKWRSWNLAHSALKDWILKMSSSFFIYFFCYFFYLLTFGLNFHLVYQIEQQVDRNRRKIGLPHFMFRFSGTRLTRVDIHALKTKFRDNFHVSTVFPFGHRPSTNKINETFKVIAWKQFVFSVVKSGNARFIFWGGSLNRRSENYLPCVRIFHCLSDCKTNTGRACAYNDRN